MLPIKSIYIASVDAKDLFLYNNHGGYSVLRGNGDVNTRKFVNTFDYSLDLIKLREVYKSVYPDKLFSISKRGKDYFKSVINVTFKYSVKKFNVFGGDTYIKYGHLPGDIELNDCVCFKDGELIAVQVNAKVVNAQDVGKYFSFKVDHYEPAKVIDVLYTVAQLREFLYCDGFTCDGVRFRRFKRSSGSSRVGKCLFIDEALYPAMHEWELCGLDIQDGQQVDLAALEAYIALTLSSIIGTVTLQPQNFLVIDDFKSVFKDRVVATRALDDGWLESKPEEVDIENSIWDGQSLIDKSAMGEYSEYGMILLRNKFFKSACFNTNIQSFFTDNCITSVSQLNGKTLAESIADIKIITTPSSIKYLKFGTLEEWLAKIEPDFGVVKHEKPTHFFNGRMVQTHYQLLNTLQMSQDEVDTLIKPSLEYLGMIQSDPSVLRYHIKFSESSSVSSADSTKDIVYQMMGITDRFSQTKLYYNFKEDVIGSYKKQLRRGHILVDGNYSTLFGNPYEMLLSAVGKFDGTSDIGKNNIYSHRFRFNQTILGSRSPHVTMGNILLVKNRDNQHIRRYFNLTDEIVCINSIGENILMRLSGADFDSDTMLLTDNPILITAAMRNYERFLVPTSLVEAKKVVRHYTSGEQADLDIKTSVNKIGEIVNLSQELNTRLWNAVNNGADFSDVSELYCDIAKLDVLSGIEIDKAKKEFIVDSTAEIRKLKKKYEERDEKGRQVKPNFFGAVARSKGYYDSNKKNYKFHDTTMDYLQHSINKFRGKWGKREFLPFSELLRKSDFNSRKVDSRQVKRIITLARDMKTQTKAVMSIDGGSRTEKLILVKAIREEYCGYISKMKINHDTAYRLLCSIEEEANSDIARTLFYMLFSLPNQNFLNAIEESKEPISVLVEDETCSGSIRVYGMYFRREFIFPAA